MGKFSDLETDIFSVFGTDTWKAEGVKTYPSNYIAVNPSNEFIRVNILPDGPGINLNSSSGLVLIDIFISVGEGTPRISVIADLLDAYLVGKSLSLSSGVTQFYKSSLTFVGKDDDNPSLFRALYTIPFNYFNGVN